jgi:hypothetical protein
VTIELAKCNIRRKREINPSGVAYQVSFLFEAKDVTQIE